MGVAKFVWGSLLVLTSFWLKDWTMYSAMHADTIFFIFSLIIYLTAAVCGLMLIADAILIRPERITKKLSEKELLKLYDSDYKERKFF